MDIAKAGAAVEVEQYRSFREKMPILLLCAAGSILLDFILFDWDSPVGLSGISRVVLCAATTIFAIRLHFSYKIDLDVEFVRNRLKMVAVLLIGGEVCCVAIGLASFGNMDLYLRLYTAISLFAISISSFVCLMHIKRLAVTTLLLTTLPSAWMIWELNNPAATATALTIVVVIACLIATMRSYQNDFSNMLLSKMSVETLSEENRRIALTDMLTGLPNRRYFFELAESLETRCRRTGGKFAIGILDLDGFKPINDSFGHIFGDRLLAEVALRIRAKMPPGNELCRLGGDEFAIVLTTGTDDASILSFGESLVEAMNEPFAIGDLQGSVGCSIGFAVFPDMANTALALYECADFALYHAKHTGRGKTVIFCDEHQTYLAERGAIEQALRTAKLEDELFPAFQPIVDIGTQRIKAFECLARWRSPSLGDVSPARFIPVAEKAGLVGSVTMTMLRKALECMRTWPEDVDLSFNVSAIDIADARSVLRILQIIEGSNISPRRITLEITETALLADFDMVHAHIEQLKTIGIRIALDDFGTGFSSLSLVNRLPLDKLKIDRQFVSNIATNPASRNIVSSILALCNHLQIECVIEGPETAEQVEILKRIGCTSAQGYYFGRPMWADDVAPFLSGFARMERIA